MKSLGTAWIATVGYYGTMQYILYILIIYPNATMDQNDRSELWSQLVKTKLYL